jgi:putative peptide zinc metalloprotease protein
MAEWTYPRFRADLVVRRMVEGSDVRFTVYDPVRTQYIRQDIYTYQLCTLLDGRMEPDEILAHVRERFPQFDFDRDWLDECVADLRTAGLLEDAFQRNLMLQARAKAERRRLLAEGIKNPLELQLITIDPGSIFRVVYPFFRLMFTRAWVIGVAIAVLTALGFLWDRRDVLVGSFFTIFTLENSGWLGFAVLYVTLFAIVLLHEFGHGLCCMHYGGQPKKMGVQLFYLMPAMFCEVSDIYFFERRWPRAAVALAGGYVELQTFSIGTLIWAITPPDLLVHEIAYRVMLFSGITGLIFNYNPLIKLDGYYVLMFWLDIQDLRERSYDWLKAHLMALVTWKPPVTERLTRRERRIFTVYGLASLTYSVLFIWAMLLLLRQLLVGRFHETGFVVLVFFAFKLTGGFWKGLGRWGRLLALERAGTIRKHWALILGGAAAAVLLALVPFPRWLRLEAVVAPADARVVRAPVAGRIAAVTVEEGAVVRPGTVLAVLASPAEAAARATARAGWEAAVVAARELRQQREPELGGVVAAAAARHGDSERKSWEAWITAPVGGRVVTRRPATLAGREVAPGDSLLVVGRTDSLEVRLLVSEREVGDLAVGQAAKLRLRAHPQFSLPFRLTRVDLAPFVAQAGIGSAAALADPESPPSRFLATGWVANRAGAVRPGMTGVVQVRGRPMNFFQRLGRAYARLVRADFWL